MRRVARELTFKLIFEYTFYGVANDDTLELLLVDADLTDDESFWHGCEGCINRDVLHRTNRRYCICTAMLFDPEEHLPAKIPDDVMQRIYKIDAGEKG